jgi:uncharacterized protein
VLDPGCKPLARADQRPSRIDWAEWNVAAFERARAESKPLLLSITAPWCRSCHEMDRTSYTDPIVAALVNDGFVPVRVDAERRPDISERYTLGGWPTTAFLTPDGEVLGGTNYIPRERFGGVLQQVSHAFAVRAVDTDALRRQLPAPDPLDAPDAAQLTAAVFSAFDDEHAGFGVEPKFPAVAAVRLALAVYRDTGDAAVATIASRTLDAMGWRGLYDEVDGGFFRYATTRDWQAPHFEKLLAVNAGLAALYLEAAATLDAVRYRDRAADTLRYVQTWLADPVHAAWAGSQRADTAYYQHETADDRRGLEAPPVDDALYAAPNGMMIGTAVAASRAFDDRDIGEFAVRSLERVLLACYAPGGGVAHYHDGQTASVRGLLEDQICVGSACLDVHEATGNIVYEMMAEELALYAERSMWDAACGGFFDRTEAEPAERVGRMRDRLKPFDVNCDAVVFLRRLSAASGEPHFGELADETLRAMAPIASRQGVHAAHYLLARRAFGADGKSEMADGRWDR